MSFNYNCISALPKGIFHSINLQKLMINYNKLTLFNQSTLEYNSNLEFLSLKSNRIIFIDKNSFVQNNKLSFIDLSYNKLTELDYDIFSKLSLLNILHLNNNNLKIFYVNMENNRLLNTLSLNNNQLVTIKAGWNKLKYFKTLYLHNNLLTTFKSQMFNLSSIIVLTLHENEFMCGCDMHWLLDIKFNVIQVNDTVSQCKMDEAKHFTIYDFVFQFSKKYEKSRTFLKDLNCMKGYKIKYILSL